MEGMTELVEEGLNIVHREERRVALGRFVEVAHIDDDRTMIYAIGIDVLVADIVHPCTWTLASTREVVGIEDTNESAVCISNLEDLYLRIVNRHTLELLEVDTKEIMSQLESTIAHIVEFEVRLEFLFM